MMELLPMSSSLRLTFHASEMNLQSLLHRCINVVLDCITTEEQLHRECPSRYMEHWDVAKKRGKFVRVHSGGGDDKLQIFASSYYLQQTTRNSKTKIPHLLQLKNQQHFICFISKQACSGQQTLWRYRVTCSLMVFFKFYIAHLSNLKNEQK